MQPPELRPDWRPVADRHTLEARARLLGCMRAFFADRGVLEVETPMLSAAGNSDPAICQVRARDGFLRSSPEYAMKRLLAAGSGDIFELGRVFREGERGGRHNPEFTLLEWYRVGWDYHDLMRETADLVNHCGKAFRRSWTPNYMTYAELFSEHTGIDPHTASLRELARCARGHGVDISSPGELDRDAWLDLLLSHVVQPQLAAGAMTLVSEYPASQAALSRIQPGPPPVAQRFELFLGPLELANGYQELTDESEQRMRFRAENLGRELHGGAVPLDERLLAALAHGLPECAGVALGVDRLLMACLRLEHIDQVLAFPAERA